MDLALYGVLPIGKEVLAGVYGLLNAAPLPGRHDPVQRLNGLRGVHVTFHEGHSDVPGLPVYRRLMDQLRV